MIGGQNHFSLRTGHITFFLFITVIHIHINRFRRNVICLKEQIHSFEALLIRYLHHGKENRSAETKNVQRLKGFTEAARYHPFSF